MRLSPSNQSLIGTLPGANRPRAAVLRFPRFPGSPGNSVLSSLANCVLVQRILFTDRNGRKRNAPGVTGVRLSQSELNKLGSATKAQAEKSTLLIRVLAECAAENLLLAKPSAASTSRESGKVSI